MQRRRRGLGAGVACSRVVVNEAMRTQVRASPQINGLWLSIWTNLMEKKL